MPSVLYMHKQFCRAVHQLTASEQEAVKSTIVDYMQNPKLPGLHWHRLDKCKDQEFASIRSSRDIRVILHPCLESEIVCYVDHHDAAYDWAEKRALKFDDMTGDVQLYEWPVHNESPFTRERVNRQLPLFRSCKDEDLKWYGVPDEWISSVRQITEAEQILELTGSIPESACEALLTVADGHRPSITPASKREVVKIENATQFEKFMDMSWDEWSVYLHPSQESVVSHDCTGDFLVTGGPGTGKTVVALHRAARMSRCSGNGKVVILAKSYALASRLRQQIRLLNANMEKCEIKTLLDVARAFAPNMGRVIPRGELDELIRQISEEVFTEDVYGIDELRSEYYSYWDMQRLGREEYLAADRSEMALRLNRSQRVKMYLFMEKLSSTLGELSYITEASCFKTALTEKLSNDYCEIIVDECQNLTSVEWEFVQALKAQSVQLDPRLALFGDMDQRIVGTVFPEKVKLFELSVNFRSSAEIDRRASSVIGHRTTRSQPIFQGAAPVLYEAVSEEDEGRYVASMLGDIRSTNFGLRLSDIALFVHDASLMKRAEDILEKAGLPYVCFYDGAEFGDNEDIEAITIATFNQAPGLEYRVVFIVGCEDGVVPPRDIENVEHEKKLLYVVMTRARDALVISGNPVLSEFLTETQISPRVRARESLPHLASMQLTCHSRKARKGNRNETNPEAQTVSRQSEVAVKVPTNAELAGRFMKALYHMASIENLESLIKLGLLSKHEMLAEQIAFRDISNWTVQSRREQKCDTQYGRNLHDYAALYINPRNAMLYTVQRNLEQVFILEIGLEVLNDADTSFVFTDVNAACHHARFYKDLSRLGSFNWDVINAKSWYDKGDLWKQQMQAEFLIHPKVLAKYIRTVLCRDEDGVALIRNKIGNGCQVRREACLFF